MDLINFLFRSTEISVLMYAVYFVFLSRHTFYTLNRFYLLAAGGCSLLLPFFQMHMTDSNTGPYVLAPFVFGAENLVAHTLPANDSYAPVFDMTALVYVSGLILFAGLLLYRMLRLRNFFRGAFPAGGKGVYELPAESKMPACSFFKRIYLPAGMQETEKALVLAHERVHVRQWHSADLLFYELLCAVFWFNPLYRLARRELITTHEFIADREAGGHDPVIYAQLLVSRALGIPAVTLHSFSIHQNLKRRLFMLSKKRSSSRSAWIYLMAIPALSAGFFIQSFSFSEKSNGTTITVEQDRDASFKGGQDAMMQYLSKNIRYPSAAKEKNIEGKVFVGFTVDENGKIRNVVPKRKVNELLDAEAVRVISAMPDWEPAVKNGKKISTELVLPITFALDKK